MAKDWITWINRFLLAIIGGVIILALIYGLNSSNEMFIPELSKKKMTLPKSAFAKTPEEYNAIGPPLLKLKYSPMSLQLPDLRNFLSYYGKNERPDAGDGEALLHFGIAGSKEIQSIAPESPLYLVYEKDQPKVQYIFSPENKETSLWIEATPREKEALVNVSMKNERGEIIRKPVEYARFVLKEKIFTPYGNRRWEIGKWKVDGTLLARQRARWYGKDLFLEKHGGEEYKEIANKQRIDFGEKEDRYSIFLGEGDAAAWINGRWKPVAPGGNSQKYPLLVLTKVEDRLLRFELWNVGGKGKVSLNLIKSSLPQPRYNLEKELHFVGARTRSQLMFEIKGKRILMGPKDWFIIENGDWIKLASPEQIDDYVDRKLVGPLFVVDEILREDGRQVLIGSLYNETRTDVKTIEIPLQQGGVPVIKDSLRESLKEELQKIREKQKVDKERKFQEGGSPERKSTSQVSERYHGRATEEQLERLRKLRDSQIKK